MKQALVLLPGLLCDAALWEPQLTELAGIARFWVPDLTEYETMNEMGEAVLRDAPWNEFALAGLSMGGYVALEVMRQAPERVTRLALLDSRARPETPDETERRRQLMKLAQTERGFTPVTSRMLPLMLHPSRVKDARLAKTIRDMAERTGVEAYLRQQQAIISRPDFRPGLHEDQVSDTDSVRAPGPTHASGVQRRNDSSDIGGEAGGGRGVRPLGHAGAAAGGQCGDANLADRLNAYPSFFADPTST